MKRWFVDRSAQQGIPSVSLRKLLPDAEFVGCRDLVVSGCSADSRRIDPGQVFVAIRGPKHDGHAFLRRALDRGAAAVVVERACPEAGIPQVVVADAPSAHSRLCQALAGNPSEHLDVVGVVGSVGTSASCTYLKAIFEAAGMRTGGLNGSGWSDGVQAYPPSSSTPDAQALAHMLSAMADRDCAASVLALPVTTMDRHSIDGIRFSSALVTSLDHVEDEPEARRRAARIVRRVVAGGAVIVNAEDRLAEPLGAANLEARRVTFGLETAADVWATVEDRDLGGTSMVLRGFDREARVMLRPIGPGIVRAALGAAAMAWSRGISLEAVVNGLETVARLPGRLEAIATRGGLTVFADRARNGDSLTRAIRTLRDRSADKVHCVMAAGVDPSLARGLAEAAEAHADRVILTSGGHRPIESAVSDLEDLLRHFQRPGRVRVVADRRAGIAAAVALACPGDAILLAGPSGRPWMVSDEDLEGWTRRRDESARRLSA